ncbi:ubiquinol-cytochrome c reductase iron-sulfur subunit [Candidatus Latescibacterota bacterium]
MKKSVSLEKRREILRKGASLLGISLCTTAVSTIIPGCESDTLKTSDEFEIFALSTEKELSDIGGAIKKTFGHHNGGRPVIIVRLGETDFVAFTSVCTHLQTEINLPTDEMQNLRCPNHGSVFSSTTGEVVSGFANAPLQKFTIILEGDVLKILF